MRAGNKNRRVRIEVLSIAKNSFGGEDETWSLLREVWAEVTYLPLKAQESHQGQEIQSEMFVQFKLDYIASLAPKLNRIVFQGQVYDIWHIAEIGYREALTIKTQIRAIAGIGTGQGIDGSAQRSAPATDAERTRSISVSIAQPAIGTLVPITYAEYALTVNGINNLKTSGGSITLSVQINGIAVGALDGIVVTSTPQNILATSGVNINVGDRLTFVLSNNTSASDLEFALKMQI